MIALHLFALLNVFMVSVLNRMYANVRMDGQETSVVRVFVKYANTVSVLPQISVNASMAIKVLAVIFLTALLIVSMELPLLQTNVLARQDGLG